MWIRIGKRGLLSDGEGVERNAAIDNDTVLNAIPSGIVIADSRSGKIRTANKAAAGMIGLEKREIVGEHFGRFFVFSFDRVETGPRFREETLNRPDGTKLPIEAEVTPLSRNGRSLVLLNFVDSTARQDDAKELKSKNETLERMLKEHKRSTDSMKKWLHCEIAEHRQTVSALRETNIFLKSIIDSSASISIISTDPNGNILFWNRGAEMLFGYTRDEALNRLNINMIYPRDESTQRKIREIRESIYEKKREISTEIEEITKTQLDVVPREQEVGQARLRLQPSEFDPVSDLVPDTDGPMIVVTCDVTIPAGEVLKQIIRVQKEPVA